MRIQSSTSGNDKRKKKKPIKTFKIVVIDLNHIHSYESKSKAPFIKNEVIIDLLVRFYNILRSKRVQLVTYLPMVLK